MTHHLAPKPRALRDAMRACGGRPGVSGFSGYTAIHLGLVGVHRGARVGPPPRARHDAGLGQFQALEEPGDLLRTPEVVRERATFVITLLGLVSRCAHIGAVSDHQMAAWC